MKSLLTELLQDFCQNGVLHREQVKNYFSLVNRLIRSGYVKKVYKKRKVFYELTEQALPLLDCLRGKMLEEVRLRSMLGKKSWYRSLLEDLRFLDEKKPEAKEFLFLGDWQLRRPVVPSQLELSKLRFYQKQGLA